mmetsp:Transcript_23819/g.43325  ORF Transcript_23819/g.43325 Transcript_23819/m.43325 type:complete len:204 (+) Transcript_23819:158-769(+)
MAFKYDAAYTKDDVVGLVDAIAPHWRKPAAEVPGLDTAKLHAALTAVVELWRKKGSTKEVDKELQALLAIATATKWFSKEQVESIDAMLDEVADAVETDWITKFDEESLRETVLRELDAREVTEVTIDPVGKAIAVEYKSGNVGTGKHDGSLHLSDEGGLRLYDYRKEGKYSYYNDELPEDLDGLVWCLQDENWTIAWDEGGW